MAQGRKRDHAVIGQINSIEKSILEFVWRWKAASLIMTARLGCPGELGSGIYKNYMRLCEKGFIETGATGSLGKHLLTTTKSGFAQIELNFGDFEKKTWLSSQPYEDRLAMLFTQGYWILSNIPPVVTYTGREIECFYDTMLPKELYKNRSHSPRSYCYYSKDVERPLTWTVEVFHLPKSPDKFKHFTEFYNRNQNVDVIFCVVKDQEMLGHVHQQISKHNFQNIEKINYVLEDDFMKSAWQSPVATGSFQGEAVVDVLGDVAKAIYEEPTVDLLDLMIDQYVHETLFSDVHGLTAMRYRGQHGKVIVPVSERGYTFPLSLERESL